MRTYVRVLAIGRKNLAFDGSTTREMVCMTYPRQTAICGVGESDWTGDSKRTTLTLAVQAITAAIEDAGLEKGDIDGLMTFGIQDTSDPNSVASALGIRLNYQSYYFGGGSSAELMVATAGAVIMAGMADTVACYRALNGRSSFRFGADIDKIALPRSEFMLPYGFMTAAQMFSFGARLHMSDYGLTKTQLGQVALTFREHANRNEKAFMYDKKLDIGTYMNARMIADPFGLFDCCLETDGSACVIVTSRERARDCRKTPVLVAGAAGRATKDNPGNYLAGRDFSEQAGEYVAPRIYGMAGITPADIDVAAFYDCFTFTVITQLEAFGFAKKGEGGSFVEEGNLGMAGMLPSNTAGGHLSEGYTQGLNNVIEVVRQLRHEYQGSERQVVDAEVGLCTGFGGPQTASGLVLEREQ